MPEANTDLFPVGVEPLEAFFARTPKLAVALSGGVDSCCLLAAAVRAGCEVHAYMVKTAFQAGADLLDACAAAEALSVPLTVLDLDILREPTICENSPNRCYWCKTFIFENIKAAMACDGFSVLADGTNASDNPARRPGFRALAEQGIVSPLRRAGFTKDQVRELASTLGVATAQKQSFSCYAVHVPQGTYLTAQALEAAARSLS